MTKTRSTKSALISSVIALLLCFAMLVGSTFAWFTDSVTSAGNIIQSGTLDVEMEWKDATANGAQQTYKDASEGAIFNYDKWEPGYVEAKNITISNVGTLALKYHLNIAANGEVSKLSDVIDVYYAEGEYVLADRNMSELTKIGTLTDVLDGMPGNMAGDLKANTSDTVTIALKMQEDAGNEYQGLSIGTNFSVVLMATQDNVEKDAFDENYDDIDIPEMSIQTIDGVTYGTTINGEYVMISVDDYTLTTFTVNENVTVLGTGNGVNDNDRVFGKNAPLTSLTLPEGLTEIKDNALNALPNLTTVNIPSTVKTIGIQSFRTTGMSEVTLPENVETVKLGAFRDMANLTTVTVEGNVAFDNYAFRSCPNLTSIYLLGDDVTFAEDCSQFATHDDNGACTSAAHKDNCPGLITIYVKNATVAARVIAAQGTSTCYEVKILGDDANGSDATEVVQVNNTAQLNTALANGDYVVLTDHVANNNVTVSNGYGSTGYSQTNGGVLDGNGNTMTVTGANGTWGSAINTTGGTIKNITVTGAFRGIFINHNSDHSEKVILENVIIDGTTYTISCDQGTNKGLKATNCTFNGWTSYAATLGAAEFIDCTFGEGNGYAYCRPYADTTFTNCVFEEGYEFDATQCTSTFINCYVGETLITSENVVNLLGEDAANIIVQNG